MSAVWISGIGMDGAWISRRYSARVILGSLDSVSSAWRMVRPLGRYWFRVAWRDWGAMGEVSWQSTISHSLVVLTGSGRAKVREAWGLKPVE